MMQECSGISHVGGQAYPSRFSPCHWLVFTSYEPEHELVLKIPGREFEVMFESPACTLLALATCIATQPEGIFQLRLKPDFPEIG